MLGGSSSINGMIFQRGNPTTTIDGRREKVLKNGFRCLPYFKKMETVQASDPTRGKMTFALERGPGINPLFEHFLMATKECGYETLNDANGYKQEGFDSLIETYGREKGVPQGDAIL